MLFKSQFFVSFSVLALAALACAAPALSVTPTTAPLSVAPSETQAETIEMTSTPAAQVAPEAPALATEVPATATAETLPTATAFTNPIVVFDRDTNCRLGPAKNYFTQTSFLQDRQTLAEGRNSDSSWLLVQSLTPKTRCWISVANLKTPEDYSYLPVIDLPPLPEPPGSVYLQRKDCDGRNKLVLQWQSVSGETGFHVYRNGIMLGALKRDAVEFIDYPPDGRDYLYEVESLNEFGLSVRVGLTVTGCAK